MDQGRTLLQGALGIYNYRYRIVVPIYQIKGVPRRGGATGHHRGHRVPYVVSDAGGKGPSLFDLRTLGQPE